jgi:hypothetical protein
MNLIAGRPGPARPPPPRPPDGPRDHVPARPSRRARRLRGRCGFPARFLADVAYPTLGVTDPARVLHICSGSVRAPFTVDRRRTVRPAVVADARAPPFQDAEVAGPLAFRWSIADPPYSRSWPEPCTGSPPASTRLPAAS